MPPGRRNRRVDQEEHQAGEVEVLGHAEDNAAYQEAIDKEVHVMAEDVVSADQIGANTVSNETTAQGELAGREACRDPDNFYNATSLEDAAAQAWRCTPRSNLMSFV